MPLAVPSIENNFFLSSRLRSAVGRRRSKQPQNISPTLFGLYHKLVYVCIAINRKMRHLLKLSFLTAAAIGLQSVNAQSVIKGIVTNNKSKPLSGINIVLKDSYDGATSDSLGRFSFTTSEKGDQTVVASSSGMKPFEQLIRLAKDSTYNFTIQLKEEITELSAVVITAGTFEASDKKRTTVLTPIDIATTAGANADVTAALKTLPGTQQVGESEGLFVRGGTASETKTFIDGTLVNNFFYSSIPNISTRSRFSPFIFKGTVFSTGGYSALYGQALSSALVLETIDLPEQSAGSVGISVIGVSGGIQKLSKNKKFSWGANYDYTNLWPAFKVIKQRQDYTKEPEYHTGDANFRFKTSATGMVKYYGYFSQNKLGFRQNSIDSIGYKDVFRLKNFNMYHNLSWREGLGNGWKMNLGFSYAYNQDDINGGMQDGSNHDVQLGGLEWKDFGLVSKGKYFNAKAVLEKRIAGLSAARFGAEYNNSQDNPNYTDYTNQNYDFTIKENLVSVFGETDIYLTNALAAKLGARFEHSSLFDRSNIAPRASLAYKLGKESQASLAYGIFYQNPETKYLRNPTGLDFAQATHYVAQYQKSNKNITARFEIFYKKYNSLIKTGTQYNNDQVAVSNNGYGDAKGIELFWRDKKTIKNFDYWVSYSYLDTKRDYLNFPTAIQPNFAAKHTASLVMKKFVTAWKTGFNMTYTYSSGRPYYNIYNDNGTNKFTDAGKTDDFHNVSFSLNYLPKLFNKDAGASKFTVLVLSVNNIFGIKQTYGYRYSYNTIRKEAIVPPSRSFVFIGLFISFGVDNTENVINNNL